jgi:hypothetical protein
MPSRREFTALTAPAALVRPGSAVALSQDGSALMTGTAKPLKYEELVDYKNKKADFVAAYPKFIDWSEVDRRIKATR